MRLHGAPGLRRLFRPAAALFLCLLLPGCSLKKKIAGDEADLQQLRAARDALHDQIEIYIDRDTYLATALAESAEVVLALPEEIIHDVFHEITHNYFDRVELNLEPDDLEVEEDGTLRVNTFLGKVTAGDWKVRVEIHQLRGLLAAGSPNVTVTGTNRLRLDVPAHLKEGTGSATLHFDWDPKGLGSLVCNKYSTTVRASGNVIPKDYRLKGDFILSAGEENLMADPEFPPDKFVISVDPSEETWATVKKEIESQDKLFKCGLVVNPDKVLAKLKEIGAKGFKVKLPRTLFRPVSLPASITKSVHVGSSAIELTVRPNVLRVTPTTFWYSASVKTNTGAPDSLVSPANAPPVAAPAGSADDARLEGRR